MRFASFNGCVVVPVNMGEMAEKQTGDYSSCIGGYL
jgi:hypothetical protein